jgi:tripartite ATP-independent transporter DctP family solute receptor
MNRREVIKFGTIAGATFLATKRTSAAAQYSFKWGLSLPSTHPMTKRLVEAFNKIKERSGGKLEIRMFADAQLGGDNDMLTQVRSGALEFYTTSATAISALQPAASILNIPFAFQNHDSVWRAVDGKLGKTVTDAVSTGTGVYAFPLIWENGYRHVTNSARAINAPKDLEGLKIRVPSSPLNVALFKALGSSPMIMSVNELYTALQTRVVDAQENPIIQISLYNLQEVQKYCSLTSHLWDGFIQLCNSRVWQSLPADLKDLVNECLTEAGKKQRDDSINLNQSLMKSLESNGMIFNQVDTRAFRSYLTDHGFYQQQKAKQKPEAWALLEEAVGSFG